MEAKARTSGLPCCVEKSVWDRIWRTKLEGLNIHYTVTGIAAKTVILVHGYTCDETIWSEQIPALAKEYRMVTLDLPGHGKSGLPKDGIFSIDLFAHSIEAVRAQVKAERVVLVGHSMGSLVVLRYAQLYPARLSALVFVDGVMPLSYEEAVARPNLGATMAGPEGRARREEAVRRYFVAGTSQEVQTKVLQMMLGTAEATAVGAMNARRDPAGQTWDIPRVPILGIYADGSRIASEQAVHEAFPWVEYVTIPGTGHFLMMEKPEEFNRLLLAFLAKQRLSATS
jgi:pimeloyl-ACP methyl ester carboxylesterase